MSVNEVIVHGIPDERELHDGDIVSIDFGAIVDGWHGDAARTFCVGEVSEEARLLSERTREAMWAGITQIRPGNRIGDVSAAVQASVESWDHPYGIVREYTGHGIGTMVTLGDDENDVLDDEWTVRTIDGSWAAHWENTVAVTPGGLWVLTEPDGGQAELEARGVPFAPLC